MPAPDEEILDGFVQVLGCSHNGGSVVGGGMLIHLNMRRAASCR
jgi:hypothetical protein